jgi:hypothetical protein
MVMISFLFLGDDPGNQKPGSFKTAPGQMAFIILNSQIQSFNTVSDQGAAQKPIA